MKSLSLPNRIGIITLILSIIFVLVSDSIIQQVFAWSASVKAEAICSSVTSEGALIKVTFSNTEPLSKSTAKMDVVAVDQQTGESVNLGTIPVQSSVTKTIVTKKQSIDKGIVKFFMTWTAGWSGKDTREAGYTAITCNPSPKPTIQLNTPCINGPVTGNEVSISWTTVTPSVMNIDISKTSDFSVFYNKEVYTVTSTYAPAGFKKYPDGKESLTIYPDTTYYVRSFNGSHSENASFSLPLCPSPTATPTLTPTPTPTNTPTPTPTGTVTPTPTMTPTATPTSTPTPTQTCCVTCCSSCNNTCPTATPTNTPTPTPTRTTAVQGASTQMPQTGPETSILMGLAALLPAGFLIRKKSDDIFKGK